MQGVLARRHNGSALSFVVATVYSSKYLYELQNPPVLFHEIKLCIYNLAFNFCGAKILIFVVTALALLMSGCMSE